MHREYGQDFRAWKSFADVAAAKAFTQFVPGQKVLIGGEGAALYQVVESATAGDDVGTIAPTAQTDLRLSILNYGSVLTNGSIALGANWGGSLTFVKQGALVSIFGSINATSSTPGAIGALAANLQPAATFDYVVRNTTQAKNDPMEVGANLVIDDALVTSGDVYRISVTYFSVLTL